jgi:hypothetical protein
MVHVADIAHVWLAEIAEVVWDFERDAPRIPVDPSILPALRQAVEAERKERGNIIPGPLSLCATP